MERAIKQTQENQSNRAMLILNLFLYGLLAVVQLYYASSWRFVTRGIIFMSLIRVTVELIVKVIFMVLMI